MIKVLTLTLDSTHQMFFSSHLAYFLIGLDFEQIVNLRNLTILGLLTLEDNQKNYAYTKIVAL